MKKYVLKPGEKWIDALEARELSPANPKPFEVRVRVEAVSLNYRDLITAKKGVSQDLVPLSDGAGVVEAVGEGVSGLKEGDRVIGLFFKGWQSGDIVANIFTSARGGAPTDGMLASYVNDHEDSFVKIPEYLSLEEAAALPCAGLTAWNALMVHGKLTAGETVVIMGTGGVALFALQLAKIIGAQAILLSSKDEKLERARKMGADELVNYTENPDWEKAVLDKTDQVGADLILELGGGGTLSRSFEAVKMAGRISLVGVLTGFEGQVNPLPILRKSISVNGIYVGSRDMQKQFHKALEANTIHPVIDRTFPLEEVKDAYEYMNSGRHFGKIIVKMK